MNTTKNEAKRRYYKNHVDEIRKKANEWRSNNKELVAQYKRIYHAKNKDKIRKEDMEKFILINQETLSSAKNHRQSWTVHDYIIATLTDSQDSWLLTAKQSALSLGRTFYSIKNIRKTHQRDKK